MKKIYYILTIVTISFILACSNTTKSQEISVAVENNILTEKETTEGWRLLFDGKTSDGWRGYKKETFPTDWEITESGEIYMRASGRGEAGSSNGGDIIYDQKFSNFHVK
ncbi:MAG TPA: family 16 glycoside hydrolase, partial [Flavobacteriaceae bacterium]|nr:family 16 glycoside hydrolase [Flavobacteriaceae bacterium]